MRLQCSGLCGVIILLGSLLSVEAARTVRTTKRHDTSLIALNETVREMTAVPPPIDYNPETKITWVDKSALPLSMEALIALIWITMVGMLPLISLHANPKVFTKAHLLVCGVVWIAMAGGVYLFHNVILFQSSHFETIRSLTLVECVYFMSQVLTTVGYGDITPAKPRGQVFVGIYVVFCILVIANVVSEVFSLVTELTGRLAERLNRAAGVASTPEEEPTAASQWMEQGPPTLPWQGLWRSAALYTLCCVVGCLFFMFYPGEGKTLLEGVYMSIITLSTVGLGVITPSTEGGKVFCAFWMLIGSTALVGLIGSFTSLMVAMKQREQHKPAEVLEHDQNMLEMLPEHIGRAQFLKFGLLHAGIVHPKDLKRIEKAFYCLKPTADGTIGKEDVQNFFVID
mmetsp:Transcript_105155/g.307332  ORF Transcript_105155/g.307332 Transcript_105155/m.307332 type:complete len:399 (+) Transcript_105155:59-1255(+)